VVGTEELANWESIFFRATTGFLFKVEDVNIKINTVRLSEDEVPGRRRKWFCAVEFRLPELNSSGHISISYSFRHFFSLDVFSALLDRAASGQLTASFLPGRPGTMFTKLGDCELRDLLEDILDEMYLPWLYYGGPDLVAEYESARSGFHFHWY